MKLKFLNINLDYDGFDDFHPLLLGSSWIGIAEVDDATGKKLLKLRGVEEVTDEVWDWFKKKQGGEEIAYRKFSTIRQEPAKNPVADYAEPTPAVPATESPSDDPKDLVKVIDVDEKGSLLAKGITDGKKSKKGKK